MINSIRNYVPPQLNHFIDKDENKYLDYFLVVTGLNQFQVQQEMYYRIYRYSYIFNFKNDKVNMKEEFTKKFRYSYEKFEEMGLVFNFSFASELEMTPIYKYLSDKYGYLIQYLAMNREEYILLQRKITQDITQYIYGFKYFYQFPFISYEQDTFLPLPHLIMHSVTSSLLFRLTEGNNELRNLFGKEVLENYVVHICSLSKVFDEIVSDYSYENKKNEKRTLDVMIKKGDKCFMLDSKSMAPRVSLRNLTEKDMEHTIKRLVEAVIQVYRHITNRFPNEYYPFNEKAQFLRENIFGAVILFEDSFVRRDVIMNKVAKELKIDYKSEEYNYLCSNVKILSLYELEKMIFENQDIFELLKINRQDKQKWFDYTFTSYFDEKRRNSIIEIKQTIESKNKILDEFIQELAYINNLI
jgi:hypothetical protein